jgi:1,4-alpha-glucan branching enzyme
VDWLEAVLLRLPQAGIEVSSLATAISRMPAEAVVRPERSSWGLGKHLGVWEGPEVAGMLAQQRAAQDALLAAVAQRTSDPLARDPWLDELAEQVLLACASDWPFMVSHHSSADYARDRLDDHLQQVDRLVAAGRPSDVDATTRPFGHVDARLLTQVARGG